MPVASKTTCELKTPVILNLRSPRKRLHSSISRISQLFIITREVICPVVFYLTLKDRGYALSEVSRLCLEGPWSHRIEQNSREP